MMTKHAGLWIGVLTATMAAGAPLAASAGEAHGGGGGAHFSAGGGGGAHFSGGGGGARFAGGGGHTVIGARAGFSGVRPNFGGAVAHGYSGPATRTAHFAASANHVYGGFAGGGHFVARPTGATGVRPGLVRPGYVGHRPAFVGGSGRFWGGGYWGGRFWPGCHYGAGFAWFLPVLPFGYATYYWGNVPYYYYDGGYYSWNPDYNGYVATDPPPVADTATSSSSGTDEAPPSDDGQAQSDAQSYDVQPQTYVPPPTNPNTVMTNPPPATPVVSTAAPRANGSGVADIFVYPRNGQSDQQTSADKTQCHNWSVAQTGFDPTRSINLQGTVADYRRAVGACLDARGYTVK